MIFTPHILVGAAIGAKTQNLGLIIILGLLTHFIMDKLPHWHYPATDNIKKFKKTKSFKLLFLAFLQIGIDILIGLIIVFLIIWQKNMLNFDYLFFILFGIIISLLPDISIGLMLLFAPKKISEKYNNFFDKYFHYPIDKEKEGKITFPTLISEILIIIISCVVLLSL